MRLTLRKILGTLTAALVFAGSGLALPAITAAGRPPGDPVAEWTGAFKRIVTSAHVLCLQPTSDEEFAPIVQTTCDPASAAQGWLYIPISGSRYRFVNQSSGYCLDAFDGAYNGGRLLQGTCKAISNEEFKTSLPLPEAVTIMSRVGFKDTGYCVDVPGNQATPGLALQIYSCNGTAAQRFVVGF